MGSTLSLKACMDLGVSRECILWRPQGIELHTTVARRLSVLGDFLSVKGNPEVAAKGLGRLSPVGEISRRPEGGHPPGLRARPSPVIAKPNKLRMVREWSNPSYGHAGAPLNLGVDFGTLCGFSPLLTPRACIGSLDLRDCFFRWLASPV